jgi:hypothetical protein
MEVTPCLYVRRFSAKVLRERDIERYLVKSVKMHGGQVRKLKWIGRRGAPDRAVFLNGLRLVELKAPGAPLRPEQKREHLRLRSTGVFVAVIDSLESVDRFMATLAGEPWIS